MRERIKTTNISANDSTIRSNKLLNFTPGNYNEDSSAILKIKEIIDETTDTIFSLHKKDLLTNPITYIIPAVWGKMRGGDLNPNQRNIFRTIDSMVRDVIDIMEFDELSESQRFSIEYLIRGLVISKITYLIASCKNLE